MSGQAQESKILGTLQDGRTIARGTITQLVTAGPYYLTVAIPNLRVIDAILDINIDRTDPSTVTYGICCKTIGVNAQGQPTVGFTVQELGASTTVSASVVAIGW